MLVYKLFIRVFKRAFFQNALTFIRDRPWSRLCALFHVLISVVLVWGVIAGRQKANLPVALHISLDQQLIALVALNLLVLADIQVRILQRPSV